MGLLGIKKKPLLPHCCFKFSPFPLLHKEEARAAVIDQGTKSKRRGAKSAEDFAEKNLGDLLPRTHRTHKKLSAFLRALRISAFR
jgi:hypothetical protein